MQTAALSLAVRADLFRIASLYAADGVGAQLVPALAGVHIEACMVGGGALMVAGDGETAIVMRDPSGRTNRDATIKPRDHTLALLKRLIRPAAGAGPVQLQVNDRRLRFAPNPGGDECWAPEIAIAYPDWRAALPKAAAIAAGARFSAKIGERLALTAQLLAQAAGDEFQEAELATFEALRVGGGRAVVQFSAWPHALAIVPDADEKIRDAGARLWPRPVWTKTAPIEQRRAS